MMKAVWLAIVFTVSAAAVMAQDQRRPINTDARAQVHQFGILRAGKTVSEDDLLELPEFVHHAETGSTVSSTWLDFSALYIIPPQMTTAPMTFQVTQRIDGGLSRANAWYPFAGVTDGWSENSRSWRDVHAGSAAEGHETGERNWLVARGMEAAATLKVFSSTQMSVNSSDRGTTEGDVFLFLRGQAPAASPINAQLDAAGKNWLITACHIWSDVQYPISDETKHAWIARASEGTKILSRRLELDPKGLCPEPLVTSATVALGSNARANDELRSELNEAIAGSGLRPDEAAAQTELVMNSIRKVNAPVLIYMLSKEWINARFPLEITGPAEKPVRVFVVLLKLPE